MPDYGPVWVVAQQEDGIIAEITKELLSKARELADRLGSKAEAVLLGHNIKPQAQELFHFGADTVYCAEDERLEDYTTLPYTKVICDFARKYKPYIILFGATHIGRDLAPRVASTLRCGLTADCTDLQIGEYTDTLDNKEYNDLLLQIRPAFGGNIIATIVNPKMHPQCATVREGVMKLSEPDTSRKGTIITGDVALSDMEAVVQILEKEKATKKIDLKKARILVSGGAGVGSRENFKLLFKLAETIGADVGASRAAVDNGYAEHDRQVGQTGVTVRPKLYIACGISGQVQHRAGMQESAKIIAINNDPEAPIFGIAHYGIVGDLNEVIPMMIDAYKAKE